MNMSALSPRILRPEDMDPRWRWDKHIPALGHTAVDFERRVDHDLAFEMDRLHRSCRRLVWLNPLLRYGGFEARAAGIRAMLPHVDEFRPVHNLASMADLVRALSADRRRSGLPVDPKFRLPRVAYY